MGTFREKKIKNSDFASSFTRLYHREWGRVVKILICKLGAICREGGGGGGC
jgi:hypothetical protein